MAAWNYQDGSTEDIVVSIEGPTVLQGNGPTAPKAEFTIRYEISCQAIHSEYGTVPKTAARVWITPDDRLHLRFEDDSGVSEEDLGLSTPYRRNTLAAGDTVRGALCYGLWALRFKRQKLEPDSISRVLMASAVLATLKCYAGSFVDFLRLLNRMRTGSQWKQLWGNVLEGS
jgi:hypothetical protein